MCYGGDAQSFKLRLEVCLGCELAPNSIASEFVCERNVVKAGLVCIGNSKVQV